MNIVVRHHSLAIFIQILSKSFISIFCFRSFKHLFRILRVHITAIFVFIFVLFTEIIFHVLFAQCFALFQSKVLMNEFKLTVSSLIWKFNFVFVGIVVKLRFLRARSIKILEKVRAWIRIFLSCSINKFHHCIEIVLMGSFHWKNILNLLKLNTQISKTIFICKVPSIAMHYPYWNIFSKIHNLKQNVVFIFFIVVIPEWIWFRYYLLDN
jgi:hypothetical protein